MLRLRLFPLFLSTAVVAGARKFLLFLMSESHVPDVYGHGVCFIVVSPSAIVTAPRQTVQTKQKKKKQSSIQNFSNRTSAKSIRLDIIQKANFVNFFLILGGKV